MNPSLLETIIQYCQCHYRVAQRLPKVGAPLCDTLGCLRPAAFRYGGGSVHDPHHEWEHNLCHECTLQELGRKALTYLRIHPPGRYRTPTSDPATLPL